MQIPYFYRNKKYQFDVKVQVQCTRYHVSLASCGSECLFTLQNGKVTLSKHHMQLFDESLSQIGREPLSPNHLCCVGREG